MASEPCSLCTYCNKCPEDMVPTDEKKLIRNLLWGSLNDCSEGLETEVYMEWESSRAGSEMQLLY